MILGLTGGIGSGKSLVSEILEKEYGFYVIQTDKVAADIMITDTALVCRLKQAFGKDIYLPDGTLNKTRYAEIIYSDRKMQTLSDEIVHPAVWVETAGMIRRIKGEYGSILVETALPGKNLKKLCDLVWHVSADENIRMIRLMETRNYPRGYAESVMKRQPSEDAYSVLADRVIRNNGTVEELREEIKKLL